MEILTPDLKATAAALSVFYGCGRFAASRLLQAVKALVAIGIVALGCAGCLTHTSPSHPNAFERLRPYVSQIANELDRIAEERRVLLAEIATTMVARLESGEDAKLTFICSHNSRRSQMSQIWAQTAAYYYGLE